MANPTPSEIKRLAQFLPFDNPTFGNPDFEAAPHRILIARLSPLRDVDRSLPHLFLFQEARRALPDAYIDLVFFPSAAERDLFDQQNVPYLTGIQSRRSAREFDVVLISNSYTLELVNLPYLLIHSHIPLFSSQRGPEYPTIILGGSNGMAAQAVIRDDGDSLVDGIFFGEGEGRVGELITRLQEIRTEGKDLVALHIPGFWAAASPRQASKAVLHTPKPEWVPTTYPILNTPEADTASLQINYGCPAFCAFCFEGYDRKPYREMSLPDILPVAYQLKRSQGIEEVSLYSFSVNAHSDIIALLPELHRLFDRVTLKSQRVDILQNTPGLLEAEIAADKHSFTLGIEGISARMRSWLCKSLVTDEITGLLERLLGNPIRRIKLFYLLTGHESEADVDEFRAFVKQLKHLRRSRNRRVRIVFSFGLLVRMPFTPLRYDRLFLDQEAWRPLIGLIKSACETNGFEFRLAFDWPAYCTTQVLALGGCWLIEPLVTLAQKGYFFDTTLPPDYWDEFRSWMERTGHWNSAFLGEKDEDYSFALDWVASDPSAEFLYRQYQNAQAGQDSGYCLGSHCLGCGACRDEEQRQAILQHRIHRPESKVIPTQLPEIVARKRRLQPVYARLRMEPWLAGVLPEFLNRVVFRELGQRFPELVDLLLSVRESLFTHPNLAGRFPAVNGEMVFALKGWDAEALYHVLSDRRKRSGWAFEIVGPAEGFSPGQFTRLHLDVHLPAQIFPDPRARLEEYLRAVYLPYSLQRERERLRFNLPEKALKKKLLFGGFIEPYNAGTESGLFASLDIGQVQSGGLAADVWQARRVPLCPLSGLRDPMVAHRSQFNVNFSILLNVCIMGASTTVVGKPDCGYERDIREIRPFVSFVMRKSR